METDFERLQRRSARLTRLAGYHAPKIVLVNEAELIINMFGPRWLSRLWRNIVMWDTRNLIRLTWTAMVDLITWRSCPDCDSRIWAHHLLDHQIDTHWDDGPEIA